MLLFLVRHALTPSTGKLLTGRSPGIHLSEKGRQQAEDLATLLADTPVAAIYSSPLERCVETAGYIAKGRGLKVRMSKDLVETDYGDWHGRSLKSLYKTKAWSQLRSDPGSFRFPGGETIRESQSRGLRAVEMLRAKHSGHLVVACTHADLIRQTVAGIIGLPIDLYHRVSVGVASVTVVAFDNQRGPQLVRLGQSTSLDGLPERLGIKAASGKKARSRK